MTEKEHALLVHEGNYRRLRDALAKAGGELDTLLDQPLVDALRALAMNNIHITALYED